MNTAQEFFPLPPKLDDEGLENKSMPNPDVTYKNGIMSYPDLEGRIHRTPLTELDLYYEETRVGTWRYSKNENGESKMACVFGPGLEIRRSVINEIPVSSWTLRCVQDRVLHLEARRQVILRDSTVRSIKVESVPS